MKKQALLFGIGGLLVGALLAGLIVANIKDNNAAKDDTNNNSSMTMEEMSDMLKGKTSDEFDKAFITGMIEHHQGAIDMANLAKQNAKHDEIKQMADDIVSAQSKEITMMKSWQAQWGYVTTPQNQMNH